MEPAPHRPVVEPRLLSRDHVTGAQHEVRPCRQDALDPGVYRAFVGRIAVAAVQIRDHGDDKRPGRGRRGCGVGRGRGVQRPGGSALRRAGPGVRRGTQCVRPADAAGVGPRGVHRHRARPQRVRIPGIREARLGRPRRGLGVGLRGPLCARGQEALGFAAGQKTGPECDGARQGRPGSRAVTRMFPMITRPAAAAVRVWSARPDSRPAGAPCARPRGSQINRTEFPDFTISSRRFCDTSPTRSKMLRAPAHCRAAPHLIRSSRVGSRAWTQLYPA